MLMLSSLNSQAQKTLMANGATVNAILDTTPTREVTAITDGYEVTYTFPGWNLFTDPIYPTQTIVKINGFGSNDVAGEAGYPMWFDTFAVPSGCVATVTLVSTTITNLSGALAPARPPLEDSSSEIYSTTNVIPVTPFYGWLPSASFSAPDMCEEYRGTALQKVGIFPVRYNYVNHTIQLAKTLKYQIVFSDDGSDSAPMITSDSKDNFLNNITLNGTPSSSAQASEASAEAVNEPNLTTSPLLTSLSSSLSAVPLRKYLIVTTSEFSEVAESFRTWKKTIGFDTEILYPATADTTSIRNSIVSYYQQNSNLYYVLIIGDDSKIPTFSIPYKSNKFPQHYSDFRYSIMDNDYTPDIAIGRIPASTVSAAQTVVDKIIAYEKNPPSAASYYENGAHYAYFQIQNSTNNEYEDRRFVHTSEDIRNGILGLGKNVERIYYATDDANPKYWNSGNLGYGEEIPVELQKPQFAWSGCASDLASKINSGVFYVLHRGHGAVNGWSHPSFSATNLSLLSNGSLTPVVFSVECLSGKFTQANCFAKRFLELSNGGCVGIVAATQISYSGVNDILACAMFDGIWPTAEIVPYFPGANNSSIVEHKPVYELGNILNQGLERLKITSKYSNNYTTYTQEIFHCLGDPSMKIWTEQPTRISARVQRNNFGIKIDAPDLEEGVRMTIYDPIQDLIVFSGESLANRGITSSSYLSISNPLDVIVSFTKHNRIPVVDDGSAYATSLEEEEDAIMQCLPENHSLTIEVSLSHEALNGEANLVVCDITGSQIRSLEVGNNNISSVQLNGLKNGVYVIALAVNGEIKDRKRIIIN